MEQLIQSPSFRQHYKDYTSFIEAKNYKGAEKYLTAVREFLCYMEKKGINQIEEVKSKQMISYYEYLIQRPNQRLGGTLSDATIKGYLFAISIFYDLLLDNRTINKGVFIPKFGTAKGKQRTILTEEEIQLLYEVAETKLETAFLSVAYGCGLRRSELERLNVQDISLGSGMLIVKKGKGSKRREVPMSDGVLEHLKDYILNERYELINHKDPKIEALFINKVGTRLSGEAMNERLKKMVKRVNDSELRNKVISLHCLRHSIAHHLIDRDAGIEFVRDFLGHSFIDTTHLYSIRRKRRFNQQIKL